MQKGQIVLLVLLASAIKGEGNAALMRPPDMAVRSVQGTTLQSPAQPAIALHVDKSFAALPVLAFPIENATWAERYIFVDAAPDKAIRRMVVVQFEHALAGSKFRFVYPSKPPLQWGDAVYRHGAFTSDDKAEIAAAPGKEVDRTRAFLKASGYGLPNYWRIARLARVADPEGKTEIIIFYQESIADSQYVPPPSPDDNDLPEAEAKALLARMDAVVSPGG